MRAFYCDHYEFPLPEGHRFPADKYRKLRELLLAESILRPEDLSPAPLATPDELELAHTKQYVREVFTNGVEPSSWKRVGIPWSPEFVSRVRATVGGLLGATRAALEHGIAGSLAGGTHHAHADRGEGFCVFNDIAVCTRKLQREGRARRVLIIDLDVHQGNGNSSIFAGDESVFVFSMHGRQNYPFHKIPSTLDVELETGTADEEYLRLLREALPKLAAFGADFVFYQMGVDALKEDALGKLALSHEGLMERDRTVLTWCRERKLPVALALGGGYARPIEPTVRAYANTYKVAASLYD
jgi:acetoin utilization deacetylase AcuC-like enzyme